MSQILIVASSEALINLDSLKSILCNEVTFFLCPIKCFENLKPFSVSVSLTYN
jgi:hypothetical protein